MRKIMKNTIYYIGAWCLLLVSCGQPVYITTTTVQPRPVVQQQPEPPQYEQSFQIFYDELAPYGKWIDYPGEGYVWCPRVEANFQPYSTRGNWVNTEHGWTWACPLLLKHCLLF